MAQIIPPKSNPQPIPSSQPVDGIAWEATRLANTTLVMPMMIMAPRMETQGFIGGSSFFSFGAFLVLLLFFATIISGIMIAAYFIDKNTLLESVELHSNDKPVHHAAI